MAIEGKHRIFFRFNGYCFQHDAESSIFGQTWMSDMNQPKYSWLGWAVAIFMVTACTVSEPNLPLREAEILPHPPEQHSTKNSQSLKTQIVRKTKITASKDEKNRARYDVPILYNKRVNIMLSFYLNEGFDTLTTGIERSGKYLPIIRKIFKEEGIPQDLAYLAATESNYNPQARSRAQAVGLWQFIRPTGLRYNLRQNQWLDERMDVLKSTRVAARHLKHLHNKFNSWDLALAAYNAGEGRVRRDIKRAKARGWPADYWSLPLPKETQRYVADFMAVTIISKNLEDYQLDHIAKSPPLDLKTITLSTNFSLQEIARRCKMTLEELREHNTALVMGIPPIHEKKYTLYIPRDHELHLATSLKKQPDPDIRWKIKIKGLNKSSRMLQYLTKYGTAIQIRVKKGDSLWKLAKKYDTTVERLRHWNGLDEKGFLKIGQQLKVYRANVKVYNQLSRAVAKRQEKLSPTPKTIVVKPGATLYSLAKKYQVSVKNLMRWNKLKNARFLKAHQKLLVSAPTA